MFIARSAVNLPTPDQSEIDRINDVRPLLYYSKDGARKSLFEKKASAILRHRSIDPIKQAKIYKHITEIVAIFKGDEAALCENASMSDVRKQIAEYVQGITLEKSDRIVMAKRLMYMASVRPYTPPMPSKAIFDLKTTVSTKRQPTLYAFEMLVFKGRGAAEYLKGRNFAHYLYHNLKLAFQTDDEQSWQRRLAEVLRQTDCDDRVAFEAFYRDSVKHEDVVYDTSFVPMFDVRSLQHQCLPIASLCIKDNKTKVELAKFYDSFMTEPNAVVPQPMLAVFRTFPFKNGYYIHPETGRLEQIFLPPSSSKNTFQVNKAMMITSDLCEMSNLESAIASAARTIPLDDIAKSAVFATNLRDVAFALSTLRHVTGSEHFKVDASHIIPLPTLNEILGWMPLRYENNMFLLPPLDRSPYAEHMTGVYLDLIKFIASTCVTSTGAAIKCSPYRFPEHILKNVFDKLTTDAEKYVFLTILIQDYDYVTFIRARNELHPIFGSAVVKAEGLPPENTRCITNNTDVDKLPEYPDEGATVCSDNPYIYCSTYYTFSDPQLRTLCATGTVDLTDFQLAGVIAQCI